MRLDLLPPYSLPARLSCLDLISRLETSQHNNEDLRHAVALISRYMLEPEAIVDAGELQRSLKLIQCLYQ